MARQLLTKVVEGWTGRLTFTLKSNGAAFVGTGMTLAGILTGADGTEVDVSTQVDWVAAASGTAYYDPASGELLVSKSPYTLRFQVTSGGRDVFFPNGEPAYIEVFAP